MMTITQLLKPKTKIIMVKFSWFRKKYWKSDLGKQIENSFERLIKLPTSI